jgi:hypothetical protein
MIGFGHYAFTWTIFPLSILAPDDDFAFHAAALFSPSLFYFHMAPWCLIGVAMFQSFPTKLSMIPSTSRTSRLTFRMVDDCKMLSCQGCQLESDKDTQIAKFRAEQPIKFVETCQSEQPHGIGA